MSLKIHIWMNFPSHHQSDFFSSLLMQDVDLKVTYYETVSSDRIALGWSNAKPLEAWETSLAETSISAIERLQELDNYIHVIPGYGTSLTRQLVRSASRLGIKWCHWSESARPGWRWWARLPTKMLYARLVNQYSLGAFAQGSLARSDFIRWGIRAEKIANLAYSLAQTQSNVKADTRIMEFSLDRGVFLFIGRMDSGKAIDVQLRAFKKLGTQKWCLVFVGSGNQEKYQVLANKLKISDQVLFLPPVHWKEVFAVHQAGTVLLLPSRYEGWGVVANEAASMSKALIISTACGSAWHLIEPGINGFLVDPGSVTSLSHAMNYYVRGGKYLALSHGRESVRISQHYTCDASASRMIQALNSWLGQAFDRD